MLAGDGAFAATTVGETLVPDNVGGTCFGSPEWNLVPTGRASGPSYAVPSEGALTSWSFESAASGGPETVMNRRVFRPHPAHAYTVVADGGTLQTIPAGSDLHTFPDTGESAPRRLRRDSLHFRCKKKKK
jgi:hypothetical protein